MINLFKKFILVCRREYFELLKSSRNTKSYRTLKALESSLKSFKVFNFFESNKNYLRELSAIFKEKEKLNMIMLTHRTTLLNILLHPESASESRFYSNLIRRRENDELKKSDTFDSI